MEKIFINNRQDKKIAVLLDKPAMPRGLAFITHGLGGIKSAPHLQTLAQVLLANNYIAVRFDATHTYGESEGGLYRGDSHQLLPRFRGCY